MTDRLRAFTTSFRGRLVLGYCLVVVAGRRACGSGASTGRSRRPRSTSSVRTCHDRQTVRARGVAGEQFGALRTSPASSRAPTCASLSSPPPASCSRTASTTPTTMQNHATRPEVAAALRGPAPDTRAGGQPRSASTWSTSRYLPSSAASTSCCASRNRSPASRRSRRAGRNTGLLLLLARSRSRRRCPALATRRQAGHGTSRRRRGDGRRRPAHPVPPPSGELGDLARVLATLRDRMRDTIAELEGGQATLRAVLDGLQDAVFVLDGDTVSHSRTALPASSSERRSAAGAARRSTTAACPASLAAAVRSRLELRDACAGEVGPDPEARYFRVTAVPLNPVSDGTAHPRGHRRHHRGPPARRGAARLRRQRLTRAQDADVRDPAARGRGGQRRGATTTPTRRIDVRRADARSRPNGSAGSSSTCSTSRDSRRPRSREAIDRRPRARRQRARRPPRRRGSAGLALELDARRRRSRTSTSQLIRPTWRWRSTTCSRTPSRTPSSGGATVRARRPTRRRSRSTSPTPASASPPSTCRASSNASTGSMRRGRARAAARDSGSRSSATPSSVRAGRVEIASEVGQGTTVTIRLPRAV